MRVAVAGGTGLVGRHVVAALTGAGHDPVVLTRSRGVDLTSGAGLAESLHGVDAVVDVSNVITASRRVSVAFFTSSTRTLLAAGRRAGVAHHVALSIVGVDRVRVGYYAGKVAQEELVLAGPVPATVLRATQFHEFTGRVLARVRGPLAVVPRMRIQPVAAREVADALAELAVSESAGRRVGGSTWPARLSASWSSLPVGCCKRAGPDGGYWRCGSPAPPAGEWRAARCSRPGPVRGVGRASRSGSPTGRTRTPVAASRAVSGEQGPRAG